MFSGDRMLSRPPEIRSIFGVDIVGFGRPDRDDEVQLFVRDALYTMLRSSWEEAGLAWDRAIVEDRGDGVLIIPPPDDSPILVVYPLIDLLGARLRRYNRLASDAARIRLRVAFHMGLVYRDGYGVAGVAINHMFRLLNALQLRNILDEPGVDLGLIVSQHVYTSVIQEHGSLGSENYLPAECRVKETTAMAWITIPVRGRLPILGDSGTVSSPDHANASVF